MGSCENYNYYKSRGICVSCRKEKAMIGAVRCHECADKLSVRDAARYAKLKESGYADYRRNISRKNNERRAKRRASGICWKCGKRPAAIGYAKCLDCLTAQRRKKDYRYNNDILRHERPSYGLCYFCGEPILTGHKVCAAHYNPMPAEFEKRDSKYWRRLNNLLFKSDLKRKAVTGSER